jgi:hypothetical protein
MKDALDAMYGRVYTSDYIVDKAVTTAFVSRRHNLAIDVVNTLLIHRG